MWTILLISTIVAGGGTSITQSTLGLYDNIQTCNAIAKQLNSSGASHAANSDFYMYRGTSARCVQVKD
ncbi:hypothetical protein RsoM2USA_32 [Ralstonia phage RsoM2USA]|nr:hypothetical protein RsoM2USA_32 [Ralstonia phage RsoM2USA]